jgi:asparagine synthase (glutamine-hydrolysing)
MCGIAGFALANDTAGDVGPESLMAMTRTLVHRGPDDEGYYWSRGIGLGSRRLSIIDLSPAGRMPMFNETRTVAVIQNGEIYNFKKIRRELEAKSHRFSSKTDTEVIVHLYEELGERCFEKLDGMYAIAIWDSVQKRLLLARDRFGEKPLYYFEDAASVAFASELRSFIHFPFFTNQLDWEALDQFLTLGYILAPRSPFLRTQKLLPGHYLIFDQTTGQTRIEQYWCPADWVEPKSTKPEAEYIDEFNQIFTESVRSRMVSDVPVGAFLSGGIDSSLVVAAMAGLKLGPVHTFSIGFPGSREHNENPFAEQVAKALQVEHQTLHVELGDVIGIIEKLSELCDEPIGDANFVSIFLITKMAKSKGMTVMLSGDGGDELFLGYPVYSQLEMLNGIYRLAGPMRRALSNGVELASRLACNSRLDKAARTMRQSDFEQASYYLTSLGAWSAEELRALKGQPDLCVTNESFLSAFERSKAKPSALLRERMALMLTYLPDNNLARMDRASMANSVETRTPFLHPALSDFSARLPMDLQIRGSVRKYILRRALAGSVPSKIVERPKHGFHALPMAAWMRRELEGLILEFLDPRVLKGQGIFNAECVARVLREHKQGGRFNHWWKLWLLLVLQMWLGQYAQKSRRPSLTGELRARTTAAAASPQQNLRTFGASNVARLRNGL